MKGLVNDRISVEECDRTSVSEKFMRNCVYSFLSSIMTNGDDLVIEEAVPSLQADTTPNNNSISASFEFDRSISCNSYMCVGICLVLWVVMGIMVVCVSWAANHSCTSLADDSSCSLLVFLASVSGTVFISSFCALCVGFFYAMFKDPRSDMDVRL